MADNRTGGLGVYDEGTEAVVTDAIFRNTLEQASDGEAGIGFSCGTGARLDVSRTVVTESRVVGVFYGGAGTTGVLSDILIKDTSGRENDLRLGDGLLVVDAAHVDASRLLVVRARDAGICVAGATATLTDVVVRGTLGQRADGVEGIGFLAQEGAHASLSRALLDGSHAEGALATCRTPMSC